MAGTDIDFVFFKLFPIRFLTNYLFKFQFNIVHCNLIRSQIMIALFKAHKLNMSCGTKKLDNTKVLILS